MNFSSQVYFLFLVAVFVLHWALPSVRVKNILLVAASYLFYGYVHAWFCILLAGVTLVSYLAGLAMDSHPQRRRLVFVVSLVGNLGLLAVFKYYNFFAESLAGVLARFGLHFSPLFLAVLLPIGISFYTFQATGYVIDVYRRTVPACRDLSSFALFVCFFPQVTSGPIGRAKQLLPQLQGARAWRWGSAAAACALLLRGLLKKLVIADNLSLYVDKVFLLDRPPLPLLAAGSIAFAAQLFADFSGYTDMARGAGRLLGIDLMENFDAPYLAHSPSDFWRRWHISLSTWLRDYLFLPTSYAILRHCDSEDRVTRMKPETLAYAGGTLLTMFLAGLWHGAGWNYVAWGLYYGILMVAYHLSGRRGNWRPKGWRGGVAWAWMTMLVVFGWSIFRAPSLHWLLRALFQPNWGMHTGPLAAGAMIVAVTILFVSPMLVLYLLDRRLPENRPAYAAFYAVALVAVAILHRGQTQDFIYFQF